MGSFDDYFDLKHYLSGKKIPKDIKQAWGRFLDEFNQNEADAVRYHQIASSMHTIMATLCEESKPPRGAKA